MKQTKSKIFNLYLELEKDTEKFVQQILVRGFKLIDIGSYKSIYSKNKLGYVIKIANSLNDEFSDLPSKLTNFYIKPYYIDERIVIQKKADTTNCEKAFKQIANKIGNKNCERYDVHPLNCGHLNNKPVLFDFAEI
jgi:hypothetical protein